MARAPRLSPEERRAERLRELCEGQYEDLTVEECKNEIARLTKIMMDHRQSKSDAVATWNGLIGDTKDKTEYLVERIDFLNHEAQVANVAEQARPNPR